jgi:hypothetical protein
MLETKQLHIIGASQRAVWCDKAVSISRREPT